MEIFVNYITVDDYKNLIFVNKEYYEIFSKVKSSLMLSHILKKEGFTDIVFHDFNNYNLKGIRLMKILIESLEPQRKFYENRSVVYKPINWCNSVKIKQRLNYLNLLGF